MSSSSPPVTVVIPVYNGMPYLTATLECLAAQTHRVQAVLAWDNCSADDSRAELERWIPWRLPGRVLGGERFNLGATSARLVALCETEYCTQIDQDDIHAPERIARQVAFLEAHPDHVQVGCRVGAIDSDSAPYDQHGWNLDYYLDDNDVVHDLLVRAAQRQPAALFRRSAVLAVGNYSSLGRSDDYELQLRLAAHGRLANLPEKLFDYRFHTRSVSQNQGDRDRYYYEERAPLFAKSGAKLFGRPESVLLRLKRREHPFAWPHLVAIARALERRNPMGLTRRMSSRSHLASVRHLIADRDFATRGFFGLARKLRGGGS